MRLKVLIFHIKSLLYTKPELGIKKIASKLKSFDLEFQPFIDEVNAKEWVIRECADAATMERVRGKCNQTTILYIVLGRVGYQQATNAAETARWPRIGSLDKSFYVVSFVCSFRGGLGLGAPPYTGLREFCFKNNTTGQNLTHAYSHRRCPPTHHI